MSGFSGDHFSMRTGKSVPGSGTAEDNDSDCEVDGSFIILANKQSPNSIQRSDGLPEVNLNVFQLGQQQSSYHQDQEVEVEVNLLETNKLAEQLLAAEHASNVTEERISSTSHTDNNGAMSSVFSYISTCSTDSISSLEEANSKVLQLLDENRNLKVFVKELNEKQKRFLENCKILESAVLKSQVDAQQHEIKYERSRAVIETLRAKVAELELESNKQKTSPKQSLDANQENEIRRLERQLVEKDSLLQDSNNQIADLKELLRKMGAELNEARLSVVSMTDSSSLQNERDVLSAAFEESKTTIEKLSQRLAEVKAMHEQQVDVNTTLNHSCLEKVVEIKALNAKWQVTHDSVQQLEKQMESREKDIQELKDYLDQVEHISRQKVAVLEAEIEEKEVFRTQMEEYKANFEEERKDRVAMKEQKDKLAEDLARFRFEELNSESANGHSVTSVAVPIPNSLSRTFSLLSRGLFGPPENGHGTASAPEEHPHQTGEGAVGGASERSSNDTTQSQQPGFSCPICHKKFGARDAVIAHASTCGEPTESHTPITRRTFAFP